MSHFTVPADSAVFTPTGRLLVPLGLMRKGPLAAFSVEGPSGRPASVLETAANAEMSDALLHAIAANMLHADGTFDWELFRALVGRVVRGSGVESEGALADLTVMVESTEPLDGISEHLMGLISQFSDNFLLVVDLDPEIVGRRSIVKFTYREPMAKDDLRSIRPQLEWEIPEFGAAGSSHFEFSPPPLLLVASANLTEQNAQPTDAAVRASISSSTSTCHLVARPSHRFVRATVTVELAPRLYGAMTAMRVGAWTLFAVLLAVLAVRWVRAEGWLPASPIGAGTPAVLLAVGGLLLTWVARTPEDWTTSQILFNARRSLMVSAALIGAAAILLVIPVHEPIRTVLWSLLALSAAVNAVAAEVHRRRCRC